MTAANKSNVIKLLTIVYLKTQRLKTTHLLNMRHILQTISQPIIFTITWI